MPREQGQYNPSFWSRQGIINIIEGNKMKSLDNQELLELTYPNNPFWSILSKQEVKLATEMKFNVQIAQIEDKYETLEEKIKRFNFAAKCCMNELGRSLSIELFQQLSDLIPCDNKFSTKNVGEGLIQAASKLMREDKDFDTVFISYSNFAKLLNQEMVKIRVVNKITIDIGFDGIEILVPFGMIHIFPDINCSTNLIYCLNMQTLRYEHIEDTVNLMDFDGLNELKSDNFIEKKFFTQGNLICTSPKDNCIIEMV